MSVQKKNNIPKHTAMPITYNDLGLEIVKPDISSAAVSLYIRALLQNWRQGTVGVKGRADVSFSNRKPWKQKGTGRARAGSPRSPLWRSGGVTFGPQPRVRTLSVTKKVKLGVFSTLLRSYIDNNKIVSIPWDFNEASPKTSYAFKLLKEKNLHLNKMILFVSIDDVLVYSSFINIPNVHVVLFDEVNPFDLMNGNQWVVLQKDIPVFKEMVSKWL